MGKDNLNGFGFDDLYEDISSSSRKIQEYEDIVSDSHLKTDNSESFVLSDFSKRRYVKRRHGLAGVADRIKFWWQTMSKKKKKVVISIASVFLVFAMLLSWFFIYWRYNYNPITGDPDELGFENVINDNVINIALFGIDTRSEDSFKGNSDSIMILSLNTETKKVKIISLMRDTFVPIEKGGKTTYGKINSAYGTGGPELAIKTINQAFNLDISEYATVNFFGMTDIIDAVGGIPVTITPDELTWKGNERPNLNGCMQEICANLGLNPSKYYINTPGEHHLNGVQAVAYARIRYCTNVWGTTNDYGRTDRQRYVMEQLFNKAVTLKKTEYAKLAKALIPCSETSLSYSQIMGLAVNILLHSPSFEQARMPQTEFLIPFRYSGYGSVVYFDIDYAAKVIHSLIYDDVSIEEYVEANGIEKNDWFGKRGSASSGNTTQNKPTQNNPTQNNPAPSPSVDASDTQNPSNDVSSSASSETQSDDSDSDQTSSNTSSSDDTSSKPDSENDSSDSSVTSSGSNSNSDTSSVNSNVSSDTNSSVEDNSSQGDDVAAENQRGKMR